MAAWIIERKDKVLIHSEYAIEDTKEAFKKLKSGKAAGKIVKLYVV